MKNSQLGIIVGAVAFGAGAIIFITQWQEQRQLERDQSTTCITYRSAIGLAREYLEMNRDEKAIEQLTRAKKLQREGSCTDIL